MFYKRKIIFKKIKKNTNLKSIIYNNSTLNILSIDSFIVSPRQLNDKNNKIRENIVGAIINNKIPDEYYNHSSKWNLMKKNINDYINVLISQQHYELSVNTIRCVHMGGRKFNYDFNIIINETIYFNIELKFNASILNEAPQFVSPMKPSQYLTNSYEDFYYDNYLGLLSNKYNLLIPTKETYLDTIHSPSPECMEEYQQKYYKGCKKSSKYSGNENDIEFYEESKQLSKKSITDFIQKTDLNISKLSDYLKKSQKNKTYMLFKNNTFNIEKNNINNYQIKSYIKDPKKSSYIATTILGKKLKILLRWKNGNGIAFPAFQIS